MLIHAFLRTGKNSMFSRCQKPLLAHFTSAAVQHDVLSIFISAELEGTNFSDLNIFFMRCSCWKEKSLPCFL